MRSKSESESESKTRQRAVEVLASHLPMDRRQALSRGETLPSRSTGAALFADVSGFTRLTETLGRTLGSQRGAEALSARLNGIYSALIAEVHDRRGSVIMFSGDAITCWFDGDDGRRATACALDLQRVMSQQPSFTAADGDEIELAIKVGVSHGPVRRFLAGDPDIRWLDVIAGATLERVAVAESLAGQGEVILAPEVADALGDHLTSLERRTEDGQRFAIAAAIAPPPKRDPWPPLGPQTLPEARIRPFLDPAVYERLRTGQALFLAEIRSVVPLFLSFTGLDFDHDDEASDKLDHYVREVQEVVQRFEGSVIDLTVGDKGTYLFSVFGAPVAHEDDAARAVAAALELRDLSRRATAIVDPRLGISQGRLHTGPSGSPSRQTYTALGDETNVAARLMSHAAAGEILASDRIARAAAPWFRFRELGSLALKGKQDQLLVHRVLGSRDAAGNTSSSDDVLVGRRAEREQLSRMLRHLIAHREHTTIVIEGEAGIGKSCLVEDLLRHARTLELRAFVGAADAIEDATPFLAWQPIWRALFGIDGLDEVAAETRVRNVLKILDDDRSRELAPLLNPLLSLDLPPSSLTAQLYGKPRAESTRDLLIALLRKFSRSQPLLIVIEDVHWLDSASWDFVETMVYEGLPLVLILATRPSTAASAAPQRRLYELPAVSRLQLGPLSHAEILELVCRRLGVIALPESLAALLRAK
ncbi:MAG: adenylate/guanylate cyclase domain-containing protein, partial [Acidobacteriota bacterium]